MTRMGLEGFTAATEPIEIYLETGGFDWGAIIAALIAGAIAATTLIYSHKSSRAALNHSQRASEDAERRARNEASWSRVTWALERATSDDPPTAKVGLTSLIGLLDHKEIVTTADAELALACADAIWDDVEGK